MAGLPPHWTTQNGVPYHGSLTLPEITIGPPTIATAAGAGSLAIPEVTIGPPTNATPALAARNPMFEYPRHLAISRSAPAVSILPAEDPRRLTSEPYEDPPFHETFEEFTEDDRPRYPRSPAPRRMSGHTREAQATLEPVVSNRPLLRRSSPTRSRPIDIPQSNTTRNSSPPATAAGTANQAFEAGPISESPPRTSLSGELFPTQYVREGILAAHPYPVERARAQMSEHPRRTPVDSLEEEEHRYWNARQRVVMQRLISRRMGDGNNIQPPTEIWNPEAVRAYRDARMAIFFQAQAEHRAWRDFHIEQDRRTRDPRRGAVRVPHAIHPPREPPNQLALAEEAYRLLELRTHEEVRNRQYPPSSGVPVNPLSVQRVVAATLPPQALTELEQRQEKEEKRRKKKPLKAQEEYIRAYRTLDVGWTNGEERLQQQLEVQIAMDNRRREEQTESFALRL